MTTNTIHKDLQDHIHDLCLIRGMTLEDIKKSNTRKAIDTRLSIILTLRKGGIGIEGIASYLDMRFCEVLSVIRSPQSRESTSSDIRAVMNEDMYDPSRKKAGLR